MKKFLSMILVLAMLCMSLAACGEPAGDGEDTNAGTDAPATDTPATDAPETEAPETEAPETEAPETEAPAGDEPNMFPYNGDVIPGSVDYDWGAPDETSVYFPVDADHIIHDGKGSWNNDVTVIATSAFDNDMSTFFDSDELCQYANTDAENVGIVLENWDGDTTKTGYVGAWIEEGVIISQIRFTPRTNMIERAIGCKFQASVDGVEWVDLHTVKELLNMGVDYEFIDIDDDTVYYYVRFLSRDLASYQECVDETATEATDFHAYCNISEFEIWGTPAK